MQIMTITTAAGVNEIDLGNDDSQSTAHFYWFKNLSDSTLYVSAKPAPVAGKDDVSELPAKGATSIETDEGKVYVLGAGKIEIHRTNSKFCPFEWASSGSSSGGSSATITVDSELSETSVNPLQNKATTAAINEVKSDLAKTQEDVAENAAALSTKSDINHIHDITASGNPVILDGLQGGVPFSEIMVSGKNLIPFPYYDGNSKTHNGITFTVNSDGSVTANGTATDIAYFYIAMYAKIVENGVTYAISGSPEGSNANTYRIFIKERKSDGTSNGVIIADFNDNKSFTVTDSCDSIHIAIRIRSGVTVDNLVFRPQLELGDTATYYEPPITGRELQVNVCGKNLISGNIIKKTGTVTDNSDSWIIAWTAAMYVRFDKIFLKPNTDYTISWWQKSDNGTDCVRIGVINGDNESSIIEQSSAEIKTGTEYKLCSFTFNSGNNRNIYVQFLRASTTGTVYVKKSIQLEIGSTATPYEPYNGSVTTITPNSNPYTIPDDIRQQDGLNNISVSAGELSVTGMQRNAAIKKIWDKFTSIDNDIVDLYSKISTLEFNTSASIEANGQEIEAVRNTLDSIRGELTSVSDDVTSNTSRIDNLDAANMTLGNDIETLRAENETLHAEIAELRALIETT